MLELRPITRDECDRYIKQHHRHHGAPVGALWRQAVHDAAGAIVGVAVSGRPVARALDDGLTVEVTRLCTDGTRNACSKLYAASKRAAEAKGYRRGLTYILASESGASLRAAGWVFLWDVKGRSWDCPSRPQREVSVDKATLNELVELHTNINTFGSIVAILEGGTIYGGDRKTDKVAQKIIALCKQENIRLVTRYDDLRVHELILSRARATGDGNGQ